MDHDTLLSRLKDIRDDCHGASGCSHEDVLQDALTDAMDSLSELITELESDDSGIDWSEAPAGTTHWKQASFFGEWIKHEDEWFVWSFRFRTWLKTPPAVLFSTARQLIARPNSEATNEH